MPMKVITVRRWEVVLVFLVFTLSVIVMGIYLKRDIDRNGMALRSVEADKASIHQLETTNCKLHDFLLSSAKVRIRLAANDKTAKARKEDLKAAKTSKSLGNSFRNELCPK